MLIIEIIILCALFTLLIVPPQYKNPISQIMSYPSAIRKRVESIPEYQGMIKREEKRQIIKKALACFIIAGVMAVIAYFSGAKTFLSAFIHTFILFFSVNLYDMVVLDVIVFCHSKWVIIKGTEDMIDEYRNPMHHIKGFCIGICLGAIVAVIAGGLVELAI